MSDLKTTPNEASVEEFLNRGPDEKRRRDGFTVLELMEKVTGLEPRMWGDSIVGFGSQHYQYASGRQGDWFQVGFSPRKQNLTLYLSYGFEQDADLLQKLGKHKIGKACLYINKIEDVDLAALQELIARTMGRSIS